MILEGNVRLSVLVTGFTIASAILDSLAFTYAADMWKDGRLIRLEAAKSAVAFFLGMLMYWAAVRYLSEAGIILAEIQTLLWFAVTMVGVGILGGRFLHWPVLEQVVAVGVFVGLGWLISRTTA